MRGKLIAVYSIVVLMTGLLTFMLMRASLGDVLSNVERARQEAARSAAAANAQLQLEGLTMQRWLSEQALSPKLREPFQTENPSSRSDLATTQAGELFARAGSAFPGVNLSLVVFVDDQGVALGRNGSPLMRGESLGKIYPSLIETIKHGTSGSDFWVNRSRNEQLLTSFSVIRDDKGKVLGVVVLGTAIDEGRLSAISDLTSGRPIAVVTDVGDKVEIVAKSRNAPGEAVAAVTQPGFKPNYQKAVTSPRPIDLPGSAEGLMTAGGGLSGYGDGKRAAIVGFAPVAMFDLNGLLLPIFGATGVGLVLAIIGAIILGGYITQPILALEEGLLAIINGDTNKRFEMEHAEFGGLISRINTLLDSLMGVEEDNTDSEGRPSQSPNAANFRDAMGVDAGGGAKVDAGTVAALRAEPAAAYYQRLYDEYIQAKRSIGDAVDHITKDMFTQRIQSNEKETSERQGGKPIRFRVELQGREVKLIAVPLE